MGRSRHVQTAIGLEIKLRRKSTSGGLVAVRGVAVEELEPYPERHERRPAERRHAVVGGAAQRHRASRRWRGSWEWQIRAGGAQVARYQPKALWPGRVVGSAGTWKPCSSGCSSERGEGCSACARCFGRENPAEVRSKPLCKKDNRRANLSNHNFKKHLRSRWPQITICYTIGSSAARQPSHSAFSVVLDHASEPGSLKHSCGHSAGSAGTA